MQSDPPLQVLRRFGARDVCEAIPSGEGRSVRCGNMVLKPADNPVQEEWRARLLLGIQQQGFRVARPVPAEDGCYVVDGWTADEWVEGQHAEPPNWHEFWPATRAFHAAIRHIPRPDFLDARTHRWANGDRVAWQEADPRVHAYLVEPFDRLRSLLEPIEAPWQVVHGDLGGNLLYHAALPPAIIDVSPFFRPVAYAEAIAVVDSFLWYGTSLAVARVLDRSVAHQSLIRAALFRLVDHSEWLVTGNPSYPGDVEGFQALATRA